MNLKKTWRNMLNRCSPKAPCRRNYYDRGISVCKDWLSFERFRDEMGEPPSDGMSIDRINVNLGYSRENCRWATQTQQMRNTTTNRIVAWNGKSVCISELALSLGIKPNTLLYRLRRGWSVGDAVSGVRVLPTRSKIKANISEVIKWRMAGETATSIGAKIGVHGSNVSRELTRLGISVVSHSRARALRQERAWSLREQGVPISVIAKELDVSAGSIYAYLVKSNKENAERRQRKKTG